VLVDLPFVVVTLARRGLARPGPPGRILRQFAALNRWGYGLAGELRATAARQPDRIALADEDRRITYRRLLHRCERLARAMNGLLGVQAGDRVGVLCRNHIPLVEVMVATSMLGADLVLLNTGLSAPQVVALGAELGLRLLVADPEFAESVVGVSASVEKLPSSAVEQLAAAAPPGRLRPPEREGRTIILTSGTTGTPKGARRPVVPGPGPLASIISRIPLRAGERMLIAAPLFHTWGYAALQISIALGATSVLRRRFAPAEVLAALAGERCTALVGVPVMLQHLLEARRPTRQLRVVAVSGSALPGGLATRFMDEYGDVLYNLYGTTEASWASIATPADLRRAPSAAGRPPHGTRVEILDRTGRPVPTGSVGRIFVGNRMLFDGYTSGAAKPMHDDLLATGDLGHIDAAGLLFVDGREDDMIVSGGENVFPSDVEDMLAALPQVREVAVIGVPDAEFGQRLAAYVVLKPGEWLDAEAVREYVRHYRARFCVPRDVVFLPELPRNATGKVLTRELPSLR
jgi:acyl-CoA synthetase (AMP-forming)/AMP-acid ligase II